MESISKYFSEEKDALYKRGRKEGIVATARNLIKRGMSLKEVSEITTLSLKEIKKIAEATDNKS